MCDSVMNSSLMQRKGLVGWNRGLRSRDSTISWYRHRKLFGFKSNRQVVDNCFIEPLKCVKQDELFGVEGNDSITDPNPDPPIYALRFCPVAGYENILGLANEDGKVALQDINAKEVVTGPLPGFTAHNNAVFDFTWCTTNPNKMLTVSGDQTARLFDINYKEAFTATLEKTLKGYTRSVKCCEWRPQSGAEVATGDRGNTILIWDIRSADSGRPDNAIREAHSDQKSGNLASVTGLLWLDTNSLVSISASGGIIKVWDIRKNYSLYKKKPIAKDEILYSGTSFSQGYTSIVKCVDSPYFYVSCIDNSIYQYNHLTFNNSPVNIFTGAQISNYFTKASVSGCGNFLASGSSDNKAYIWNTESCGSYVATLEPQEEPVTCVAWSYSENILVTCTDDSRHRIWRGSRCEDKFEIKGAAHMNKNIKYQPPVLPPSTPTSSGLKRLLRTPGSRDRRQALTGAGGTTPSIKAFLTPKNSTLLTPKRQETADIAITSPVSANLNTQKRKLDLSECSTSSKYVKLDSEVAHSITQLLQTNATNIRISPTSFKPTVIKQSSATPASSPRKFASPLKNPVSPSPKNFGKITRSPAGVESVRRPLESIFSPTANLPNIVRDGRSPRHVCTKNLSQTTARSPLHQNNTNWLLKLGQQRKREDSSKKEASIGETNKKKATSRTTKKSLFKKSTTSSKLKK